MENDGSYWPEIDDPINIFEFFNECPDIRPPEIMQDIPRYAKALYQSGQYGWSAYFEGFYNKLCRAIEEEVSINA